MSLEPLESVAAAACYMTMTREEWTRLFACLPCSPPCGEAFAWPERDAWVSTVHLRLCRGHPGMPPWAGSTLSGGAGPAGYR